MSKKRNLYKNRSLISIQNKQQRQLEREVKLLVNKVNNRLNTLSRWYRIGTWGTKELRNELDTLPLRAWKRNRVYLNKGLDMQDLYNLHKILTSFLRSPLSTRKGIESRKKSIKEGIKRLLFDEDDEDIDDEDIDDEDITDEEVDFYFNLFGDRDFDMLVDKYGYSDFVDMLQEAREKEADLNQWFDILERTRDFNDVNIRNAAERIYYRYILSRKTIL